MDTSELHTNIAFNTLISFVLALGSVMVTLYLLGGNVKGKNPVETGRRWMNWVIAVPLTSTLLKVFSSLFTGTGNPLRVLVEGMIGIIGLAIIAFFIGFLVAYVKGKGQKAITRDIISTKQPLANRDSDIGITQNQLSPRAIDNRTTPTQSKHTSEEVAYELVTSELESNTPDKALWTKAFAQSEGNEIQTKVLYIKLRVEKLMALNRTQLDSTDCSRVTIVPRHNLAFEEYSDAIKFGLSEEEIDYLEKPIMAIRYLEKYRVSKEHVSKAIRIGKIRSVLCQEVLWVQDRRI